MTIELIYLKFNNKIKNIYKISTLLQEENHK